MNKYSLSLALTAILEAVEARRSVRELRMRGMMNGKGKSVPAAATAPLCNVAPAPASKSGKGRGGGGGKSSKSGKNGGRNGGKGKGKSKQVEEPEGPCPADFVPMQVDCGDVITGSHILNEPLVCDTAAENVAIRLDGPDAVLDCNGFGIYADPLSAADNTPTTIGVILDNGATLTNCIVSGFEFGAQVRDGDNTITSSTFMGNYFGIFLNQGGCDTIMDVNASYNERWGVSSTHAHLHILGLVSLELVDMVLSCID